MVRFLVRYFVPKRWKTTCCLVLPSLVTFLVLFLLMNQESDSGKDPEHDYELDNTITITQDHLGIEYCPVCFGHNESLCEGILHSTVKLRCKKKAKSGQKWKPRAIGVWNKQRISIKHFGNSSEFYKLDNEMCSIIGKINAPCDVNVAWNSFINASSVESAMKETMDCPSKRLIAEVKKIYSGQNVMQNILHLTATLNLNQEPLIFQVFPSEKGWPFPKFYGACGRALIMEDAGIPLDYFLLHPWIERAKLAVEVIKIAKRLTNNQDRWGLYLTEIELDSFVVSNTTVKLEDASGILVVDLLESNVKGQHKKTVDECHRAELRCLSSHPSELCQGVIQDQNYYAVCRGVLADKGNDKGLLHSPPEEDEFNTMLEDALTECITAQTIGRKEAIDLVLGLLQEKISASLKVKS